MRLRLLRAIIPLGVLAVAAVTVPSAPASATPTPYRVENSTSTSAPVTVSCGSDTVIGMGGRIDGGGGNVIMSKVSVNSNLDTVTVQGVQVVANSNPYTVRAYAVCAPAGMYSGLHLVETPSLSNNTDKTGNIATCTTAGEQVFGGGYRLEQAGGKVAVDSLQYNSLLTTVTASAYVYDSTVGNFTLTTQAICGPSAGQVRSQWTSATSSLAPKTESTMTCPSGDIPAGVGGTFNLPAGGITLTGLVPYLAAAAAEATGDEIGTYTGIWNLTAQQICVPQ